MAQNERLFREANEILRGAAAQTDDLDRPRPFICECADAECLQELRLTLAEYARVREGESRFAVASGHETDALEEVVERNDRYWVVARR